MKILVACEFSGIVRDAFIAHGHTAVSCDLFKSDRPGPHIQQNVLGVLNWGWDILVAFPPCTYLCASGMHWTTRGIRDKSLTDDAIDFVKQLMAAPIDKIAIENPVGCISTRIRKPDQIIQPHEYGHDASKATCLWLKNLPLLTPTKIIPPRIVNGRKRWANQTDSGQNALPPSADRSRQRSTTYSGIAQAMAEQWSRNT